MKTYSYANPTDWLTDTARRNPEALLLMAAGCALLMRTGRRSNVREGDHTRDTMRSRETFGLTEGVRQASDKVSQTISDASDKVSGYVGNVRDRISDAAGSYGDSAIDYASQTRRSLSSQNLREQPLLVTALGLLTGAAVASLFPPTEVERGTLGQARLTVLEASNRAAENLTQAAGKTAQHFKDEATKRGMAPDSLKEMARDAAATFSTAMAGGSEQVREESEASTARDGRP